MSFRCDCTVDSLRHGQSEAQENGPKLPKEPAQIAIVHDANFVPHQRHDVKKNNLFGKYLDMAQPAA
jgi:hypothetical protein